MSSIIIADKYNLKDVCNILRRHKKVDIISMIGTTIMSIEYNDVLIDRSETEELLYLVIGEDIQYCTNVVLRLDSIKIIREFDEEGLVELTV